MKRHLMLALFASALLACNNGNVETKNEEGVTHDTTHAHDEAATTTHADNEATTLSLNNGAKWKSDLSTTNNVNELKAMTHRFNENKNKTLADYTAAGNELQAGLDKMIKECRMEGPDHDALHLWLEPLMKNIAGLKKATDETAASEKLNLVEQHVNTYNQFFE